MEAVEKTINCQKTKQEFFIVLTLKAYPENPTMTPIEFTLERANWQLDNYIKPANEKLNSDLLNRFVNEGQTLDDYRYWTSILGVSFELAEICPRIYNVNIYGNPYFYIGETAGYKSAMISIVFQFKKIQNISRDNGWENNKKKKFAKYVGQNN